MPWMNSDIQRLLIMLENLERVILKLEVKLDEFQRTNNGKEARKDLPSQKQAKRKEALIN